MKKIIKCSDRMCGADDCPKCHPENFRNGVYLTDENERIQPWIVSEQDFLVIQAMKKYGGSFVRALAEAATKADEDNLRRMREAWPDYWFRYSAMSKAEERPLNANAPS